MTDCLEKTFVKGGIWVIKLTQLSDGNFYRVLVQNFNPTYLPPVPDTRQIVIESHLLLTSTYDSITTESEVCIFET